MLLLAGYAPRWHRTDSHTQTVFAIVNKIILQFLLSVAVRQVFWLPLTVEQTICLKTLYVSSLFG